MKNTLIIGAILATFSSAALADLPAAALDISAAQAAVALSEDQPNTEPFAKGTWAFQTYGSATFLAPTKGEAYIAHIGFGYHFFNDFSVNLEATGSYLTMEDRAGESGGDAGAGGLDLLARWHFLKGEGWSLYGDIGSGFMQSSESFPSNGTHFNFTPQAGFGATLRLVDNVRLMTGFRWHHVSNARLPHGKSRNPGFDALMLYAGIMIPF